MLELLKYQNEIFSLKNLILNQTQLLLTLEKTLWEYKVLLKWEMKLGRPRKIKVKAIKNLRENYMESKKIKEKEYIEHLSKSYLEMIKIINLTKKNINENKRKLSVLWANYGNKLVYMGEKTKDKRFEETIKNNKKIFKSMYQKYFLNYH